MKHRSADPTPGSPSHPAREAEQLPEAAGASSLIVGGSLSSRVALAAGLWSVASGLSVAWLGPAPSAGSTALAVALLSGAVGYAITRFVARRLLRPLDVLIEGTRRVAAGETESTSFEPARADEIGELARSVDAMLRGLYHRRTNLEDSHGELVTRNLELQRANEVLNQLSITDGLTKLHNHRFFQDHLTREIKRVNRVNEPLSMVLIDIDDFKTLNDRYGHAAGDELLVSIARLMEESVRDLDLLARYGGEEFVIIAVNTDRIGAYQLAEKIRTNIAERSFLLSESLRPMRLTVSMGVAEYEGNRKRFFVSADRALYSAKDQGKNCVVVD